MARYTDAANTGVPAVPSKTTGTETQAETREAHKETVLSHRLD